MLVLQPRAGCILFVEKEHGMYNISMGSAMGAIVLQLHIASRIQP